MKFDIKRAIERRLNDLTKYPSCNMIHYGLYGYMDALTDTGTITKEEKTAIEDRIIEIKRSAAAEIRSQRADLETPSTLNLHS